MSTVLRPHYSTLFLRSGDSLILVFEEGAYPFRIKSVERSCIKPLSFPSIASGDKIEEEMTWMSPKREEYIAHYIIGLSTDQRVWWEPIPRVSYGYPITGADIKRPSAFPSVADTDIGYVDSDFTPYDNPQWELFYLKGIYPKFIIYNPTGASITPTWNVQFAIYRYTPVTSESAFRKLVEWFKAYPTMAEMLASPPRRVKVFYVGNIETLIPKPVWLEKIISDTVASRFKEILEGE